MAWHEPVDASGKAPLHKAAAIKEQSKNILRSPMYRVGAGVIKRKG
jgi:hypothetical protein